MSAIKLGFKNASFVLTRRAIDSTYPPLLKLAFAECMRNLAVSLVRRVTSVVHVEVMRPKVVFVLGGPGAGKGTQCSNIVRDYGFVHLSAGDLLREERNKEGTTYGELIERHIREGSIVPVEITCRLIERAMNTSKTDRFLIDGFPRNKDNLEGWNREMADKVELLFVLFFDCDEKVCVERCLERGAAGSGRSDDNPQSLKKRIQTFMNDSLPIIEYYKALNLVKTVNASNSKEEVFNDVKKIFDQLK